MKRYLAIFLALASVSGVRAGVSITDAFFHRGWNRDRLVLYLSGHATVSWQTKQQGARSRLTLTVADATFVSSSVRQKAMHDRYREGYHVHCMQTSGNVVCTCTYDPARVRVDVAQDNNVRSDPMVSITMTRTNQVLHEHLVGAKTVVIDPGHGGAQLGAEANGFKEKTLALRIAKQLRACLASWGYHVVMTRQSDNTVELDERTSLANRVDAALFVSLHHNLLPRDSRARGIEILYADERDYAFARRVYNSLQELNFGGKPVVMRGLKRELAQVLYGTEMPSILVELFFLSNPDDLEIVTDHNNQATIAQTMCRAIRDYLPLT